MQKKCKADAQVQENLKIKRIVLQSHQKKNYFFLKTLWTAPENKKAKIFLQFKEVKITFRIESACFTHRNVHDTNLYGTLLPL